MAAEKLKFPRWAGYALLCILCWGIWGILSKVGSDRMDPMQMQVLFTAGMLPPVLFALYRLGFKVEMDRAGAIYGILNGVFTGLGLLAFYAALARGKASIVGPVTALFPLLTVLLALLILQERLNRIQSIGVFLALAAIFVLAQ
jgi:transporter family protein